MVDERKWQAQQRRIEWLDAALAEGFDRGDAQDMAAAREAMRRIAAGETPISLVDLRAELGLEPKSREVAGL